MKMLLPIFVYIAVTCSVALHAAAEPCQAFYEREVKGTETQVEEIIPKLNSERRLGCILGNTDGTRIKEQYQKLRATPPGVDLGIERGLLLELVLREFDGVQTKMCKGLTSECVAGRHLYALRSLGREVRTGKVDLLVNSRSQWTPTAWDSNIAISDVNLAAFVGEQCKDDIDKPGCADAVTVAAKILRTSLAVNELITSYQAPVIGLNDRFLSGRDREWEAYLNGESVQFPWELAVNSWRFDKESDDKDKFPRAPTNRWVLFHPSPALEVIDSPLDGNSTEAAVLVEIFGYQRWRWRDGQQAQRWGASGIISMADIYGMETFGYGVLLHTPMKNAALGVIWRDGDGGGGIGVVLNLNLAKLLKSYGNDDLTSFLNR